MSLKTSFLKLFKWNTSDDEDLNKNFDINAAMNDNLDRIDNAISDLAGNKVDKVAGKQLSTEDYTTSEKTKLNGIASGAQVNVLENLTLEGKTLAKNNKTIEIKDSEVTNARKSTIKAKIFNSVNERIESIEEDLSNIDKTSGHIYGIRRKITNNSNSAWERLFDSIGKVANATKNGGTVQNDFDGLAPWSEINSCNYDTETGKVKAWYGDATFKFDGSNGDVFTYIPDTFIKVYQDNDYDYILISDVQRSGFKHYDSFFIGRYSASKVNGKLRTYSDLSPEPISLNDARTLAKALGSKVHVMDYRYFIITLLYLVEYADYNSQKILGQGVVNGQDVISLIAETSTNRIVVSSDLKGLYVGRQVAIGSAWWNNSIADRRRITKIEDYTDNDITGKSITFDGDAVNIAVGSHMWGIAQHGGNCDKLGMKSGCVINDGVHDMIYRGIEGLIGNIFNWIDGILLQKDEVYICTDPSLYNSNDYTKYKKLSYVVLHGEGAAKTMGYDPDEPLIRYPVEVGANNNTYLTDYYWNNSDTNIHAPRVGGSFSNGAGAGLFCWGLVVSPAYSDFSIGCRLLIENQ